MFGNKSRFEIIQKRLDGLEEIIRRLNDNFELQIGDINRRELDKCETINVNFNRLNTMLNEFKGVVAQSRAQFKEFQEIKEIKPKAKKKVKEKTNE